MPLRHVRSAGTTVLMALLAACSTGHTPVASGARVVVPSPDFQNAAPSPSPALVPLAPTAPAASPGSTTRPVRYPARCAARQLRLGWGGRVSEATGQDTLALTLTNLAPSGCYLYGYPGVSLADSKGHVVPLVYQWTGDQMVTSSGPTLVNLPPHSIGYVTVNKYRCDTETISRATVVRVIPPDDTVTLALDIPATAIPMDYCGPGDPGSVLHISPIESTFFATTTSS